MTFKSIANSIPLSLPISYDDKPTVESFVNFHNRILLEANYSYTVPNDKEVMMYDFYMISHWLNALNYRPGQTYDAYGQEEGSDTFRMGLKDSTKYSFEHIKEQLLNHLQEDLLEASFFSICCELRHWSDSSFNRSRIKEPNSPFTPKEIEVLEYFFYTTRKKELLLGDDILKRKEIKRLKDTKDLSFGKEKNQDKKYLAAYVAGKKALEKFNITRRAMAVLGEKAFDRKILNWSHSFGGPAWMSICVAHKQLADAKSLTDKTIYIDNMYHQQHNTDTVFNKLRDYYKEGYQWIVNALNFKANNKEPYELIRKIRDINGKKGLRSVDRMYIEMLKAAGKKSYQEYFKKPDSEEAPKKSESNPLPQPVLPDIDKPNGHPLSVKYLIDTAGIIAKKYPEVFSTFRLDAFKEFGETYFPGSKKAGFVCIGIGTDIDKPLYKLISALNIEGLPVNHSNEYIGLRQVALLAAQTMSSNTFSSSLSNATGGYPKGLYFVSKNDWELIYNKSEKDEYGKIPDKTSKQTHLSNNEMIAQAQAVSKAHPNVFFTVRWDAFKEFGETYFPGSKKAGFVCVGTGTINPGPLSNVIYKLGIPQLPVDIGKQAYPGLHLVKNAVAQFYSAEEFGKNGFHVSKSTGNSTNGIYFVPKKDWELIYNKIEEKEQQDIIDSLNNNNKQVQSFADFHGPVASTNTLKTNKGLDTHSEEPKEITHEYIRKIKKEIKGIMQSHPKVGEDAEYWKKMMDTGKEYFPNFEKAGYGLIGFGNPLIATWQDEIEKIFDNNINYTKITGAWTVGETLHVDKEDNDLKHNLKLADTLSGSLQTGIYFIPLEDIEKIINKLEKAKMPKATIADKDPFDLANEEVIAIKQEVDKRLKVLDVIGLNDPVRWERMFDLSKQYFKKFAMANGWVFIGSGTEKYHNISLQHFIMKVLNVDVYKNLSRASKSLWVFDDTPVEKLPLFHSSTGMNLDFYFFIPWTDYVMVKTNLEKIAQAKNYKNEKSPSSQKDINGIEKVDTELD